MSAEQKQSEPNALAATLSSTWSDFKQGKLISYKVMAVLLLVVAGIGLWWYIAAERRKQVSNEWREIDEANTPEKLEKIAADPDRKHTAKIAELLLARTRLGPEGIEVLSSSRPEVRQKAIENIEKARETFGKLLEPFKNDPVFKAQCLLGLAKSEAVLVGVPVKSDQAAGPGPIAPGTEFKGQITKVIEYLDQFSDASAPETPWATESKKMADALRKDSTEFVSVQRKLTGYVAPSLTGADFHAP